MTNLSTPVYDSLHFKEYLDGGVNKLPYASPDRLGSNAAPPDQDPFEGIQKNGKNQSFRAPPNQNDDRILIENYSHICQQTLQCSVVAAEFPGGRQRSSFRLLLDNGHTAIASRRFDPGRARLEYQVLRTLSAKQAPVPRCYAFNGLVLIQEDLPGTRLSEALKTATDTQYTRWMHQALTALLDIRQRAASEDLHTLVPVLGCEPEWLVGLIDRTALLGQHVGLPCPRVPVEKIYDRLILLQPRFTKWDARPGNAMLDHSGRVKWFDWEHCCARNPMDDVAWLLCDDAAPEYPEAESDLINTHLDSFADGRHPEQALSYLSVFGTHHACVRICRLLDEKAFDSWDEFEQRVAAPLNSLLPITQRLCRKAARWAAKSPETAMLADWFLETGIRLPEI